MSGPIGRAAAGVAAALLLGATLAPGVAGAAPGRHHDHHRGRHHRHLLRLTAEQRECLASQGVTFPPAGRKDGATGAAGWRVAFTSCGIRFPPHHHHGGWPSVTSTTTTSTTTTSTTTTTTTLPPPIEPPIEPS